MTMQTQHTPGPWRTRATKAGVFILGAAGEVVSARFCNDAETELNAAFIVRACNSHAELVTLLELTLPLVSEFQYGKTWGLADLIRAALAKAGGV